MSKMKALFGVHLWPGDLSYDQIKEICISAEEQDYDIFTITDHFYPRLSSISSGYPLECWTTLSSLAATTIRIRIGSLVSCILYRNPAILGKMATTVDIISKGRIILGIGACWHEEEFKAVFDHFPTLKERGDALDEAAQLLKRVTRNRESTFEGKVFKIKRFVNLPPPVQKAIPILIGGGGERRTLLTAARYGDISHFNTDRLEEVDRKIQVLKNHCRKIGRDFSEIKIAVRCSPTIEKEDISKNFYNFIEDCLKLGVSIFTLRFFLLNNEASKAQKIFAQNVIPSFNS